MIANEQYSPMLQGAGSNKFTQVNTRSMLPETNTATGAAVVILDESWEMKIEGYDSSKCIRTSTHKLLNAAIIALTKNNKYRDSNNIKQEVFIHLEDFMKDCGIPITKPSKDKTRQRVKEDLETLFSCCLSWKEKKGKKTSDFRDIRLIQSKGLKNNVIEFEFSHKFAKYLIGSYVMQFPKELLCVNERNPSSFILGQKLALYHNINSGKQGKSCAHVISVKALLTECKQTIPSYETVMSSDRCTKDRIRKPFEDALNDLQFIVWEYLTPERNPISKKDINSLKFTDYLKLFVQYAYKEPLLS